MPREWSNKTRDAWNTPIHQLLKAIDNHTQEYLKSKDVWHLKKAEDLRQYISELKDWILIQEKNEEKTSSHSHTTPSHHK